MPQAVETIIARCLIEPGFLGKPGAANESLAQVDFEPAELGKIRRFAGFICKVKHNHLWGLFPATRRLICHYGIELDIFTKYRLEHDPPAFNTGIEAVDDRLISFINFLDAHFSSYGNSYPYPMLLEVLRHERFIWETRLVPTSPASQSISSDDLQASRWIDFQRLVVGLDPSLRLFGFHYDVQAITAQLEEANLEDEILPGPDRALAYYFDRHSHSVRVVEVDPITTQLLSLINGKRSVRRVIFASRALGLGHARPVEFREFFEDAHRFGIIKFLPERAVTQFRVQAALPERSLNRRTIRATKVSARKVSLPQKRF